ncbi:hypothetical protein C0989_001874 [Termitomyces sp. Mn162]|nr:hypothetical protein C0989_001874 [Termitomyces sp. Mn162]
MEGLLNQIELMKRQCITVLEQIDCIAKHKFLYYEGASVEPKWARPPLPQAVKSVQAVVSSTVCVVPIAALIPLEMPAWPTAAPVQQTENTLMWALEVPLAEVSLEQQDEEMDLAPLSWGKMELLEYNGLVAEAAKATAASKEKQKVVPIKEDKSNYGQLSSKVEEEEEESKTPTQHF